MCIRDRLKIIQRYLQIINSFKQLVFIDLSLFLVLFVLFATAQSVNFIFLSCFNIGKQLDFNNTNPNREPWIMIFINNNKEVNEYMKKSQSVLTYFDQNKVKGHFANINCQQNKEICDEFHITKDKLILMYDTDGKIYEYDSDEFVPELLVKFLLEGYKSAKQLTIDIQSLQSKCQAKVNEIQSRRSQKKPQPKESNLDEREQHQAKPPKSKEQLEADRKKIEAEMQERVGKAMEAGKENEKKENKDL
eukprot:TRINITY_DN495_c0_g1_i5.p1 TRINITY_DN495_c0_g1~~TRINITY_DN495_c0_g1_i5.p1  ORF type:complete len:248 (+),score=55.86 TRINITY_DN495_c0_g1_i5:194-937(+)